MRFLMKTFITFLIFGLYFCPERMSAGDLIGIVVANTLPRENNVGREYDVMKIIDELEVISKNTGLKLDLTVFMHEEYDSKLITKLKKIDVNPDDVVFFYYSGHGYRTKDKNPKNPWPNIHIGLENKGIDHDLITKTLHEKGPRLLLSMVSSCNNVLKEEIELIKRTLTQSANPEDPALMKENYKKLFLDHSGTIVSSSAIPGQSSFRDPNNGTIYLEGFLNALHEEVKRDGEPQWEPIFLGTVEKVQQKSKGKQISQYELNLN